MPSADLRSRAGWPGTLSDSAPSISARQRKMSENGIGLHLSRSGTEDISAPRCGGIHHAAIGRLKENGTHLTFRIKGCVVGRENASLRGRRASERAGQSDPRSERSPPRYE